MLVFVEICTKEFETNYRDFLLSFNFIKTLLYFEYFLSI